MPAVTYVLAWLSRLSGLSTRRSVVSSEQQTASHLDADAAFWYNAFKPMLDKLLRHSCYSESRRNDVLEFFASNMVPFLGPAPKFAARRWRSFMTPDNTPMEPSLAWSALRPAPRTRLAIDIIPNTADVPFATAKQSIDFAVALRQYVDGSNGVSIIDFDLELFFAIAQQLFGPLKDNPLAQEEIADLVSGPSLTFFGLDIEQDSSKVKAYFIPALTATVNDEHPLKTFSDVFLSLGDFSAWAEIVGYIATLPPCDWPMPFILSVDCVPRQAARYKVYFRWSCSCAEDLILHMSLGGRVELSPQHIAGVVDMWNTLAPRTELLDDQKVIAQSGLCVYYDFKEASRLPAVKVYLPVQNWASNDLKAANAIARWLRKFGHKESADSYVRFVSDLWCVASSSTRESKADRPNSRTDLVSTTGFHTYVGIASKDGGCEATTYYNAGMFQQEISPGPSTSR